MSHLFIKFQVSIKFTSHHVNMFKGIVVFIGLVLTKAFIYPENSSSENEMATFNKIARFNWSFVPTSTDNTDHPFQILLDTPNNSFKSLKDFLGTKKPDVRNLYETISYCMLENIKMKIQELFFF